MLGFEILATDPNTHARCGRITTRHGSFTTPVFMPVGTAASVKSLDQADLATLGADIILGNTYHLALRPGDELIARQGGLHRFMGYGGSILTDSGGFQVFSLAARRRVTDRGVVFRSHIDGALLELTPERAVAIQENLGSDIAMQLDECPPALATLDTVRAAVERSTRWAERCLRARAREDMGWFGIVQGALSLDLRFEHISRLAELDFDGYAIGGVSVGEAPEDIASVVCATAPRLPAAKPRYLMGVGTPADLVRGVAAGVDMFDCVMPTRNARNGQLFTSFGKLNIKSAAYRESLEPIDPACRCPVCRSYSRSYIRHLYAARELSYYRLATLHNLFFYLELMREIGREIRAGSFRPESWLARLEASSPPRPPLA